jgi:hypothetical protein
MREREKKQQREILVCYTWWRKDEKIILLSSLFCHIAFNVQFSFLLCSVAYEIFKKLLET